MQNQKTAQAKIDFSDLPDLTPQQLKFVDGIAAGKSNIDAYKAAYNCAGSAPTTIQVESSKLRHNPKIALWLSALRSGSLQHVLLTRDEYIRRLFELAESAKLAGNYGAAVQAFKHAGDAMGHHNHVERLEVVTEPMDALATIAKEYGEETASKLAVNVGVNWHTNDKTLPN